MNPLTYLHLQMRLEGKEIVKGCLMRQADVVPGEELPLVLIAQLVIAELMVYYDEAISSALQKELAANTDDIEFPRIDSLLHILERHHVGFALGHYKTYIFPALPSKDADVLSLSKYDPKVKAFGFDGFAEQVYAIERDEELVSACVSARENEKCGEAWMYTAPEYRHQGLGQKVVHAWARSLMDADKVPFYSHKIENAASANLAGKIGLQPIFEEIAIMQR